MDFHDDHAAFDATSTDEVSHMYVPGADDHGIGDDAGHDTGPDDTHGTEPTGSEGGDTVSVNVGGHEVRADATLDTDHDGENDTAIVTDSAGDHIAITDTDGDGEADHAALLDESGHVVQTAHLDSSGTWVQDGPGDTDPYGGPGAPIGAGDHPGGAGSDTTGTGATDSTGTGATGGAGAGGSTTITVDVGGHSVEAPATVDTDQDGTSDTAVVDAPDGNKIAFTDSDGDGQADRAAVYDSAGRLLGTAHYDRSSGNWIEGSGGSPAPDLPGGEPGTSTAGAGSSGGLDDGSATSSGGADADGRPGDADGGIGTSPAGTTGAGGGEHIEVSAGGRSARVEADYDLDHDGRDETAVVRGADGTRIAFSDTDGDGDADRARVYDADGRLVGTASYDDGTWVQDRA